MVDQQEVQDCPECDGRGYTVGVGVRADINGEPEQYQYQIQCPYEHEVDACG